MKRIALLLLLLAALAAGCGSAPQRSSDWKMGYNCERQAILTNDPAIRNNCEAVAATGLYYVDGTAHDVGPDYYNGSIYAIEHVKGPPRPTVTMSCQMQKYFSDTPCKP